MSNFSRYLLGGFFPQRGRSTGDMDRGHRVLDSFVLKIRKEHIGKLEKMAPPRKD